MVSSIGASGAVDDGFISIIVNSLVPTISISGKIERYMTTLYVTYVRVSVTRKLLVVVMCTV